MNNDFEIFQNKLLAGEDQKSKSKPPLDLGIKQIFEAFCEKWFLR